MKEDEDIDRRGGQMQVPRYMYLFGTMHGQGGGAGGRSHIDVHSLAF